MSDDKFDLILADLARVRDGMTSLRTDLMSRMDRMADTLNAIRDDIATNYGAADHALRLNQNTRDEGRALHDVMAAMQRQILRLQTDVRELKGGD